MYDVSEEYLVEMKYPAQIRKLTGTLSAGNDTPIVINPENVLQNTVSISNQCSGSNEIQIGQVYIGKLNITLRGLNVARGTYKGRVITLYESLYIEELEDWETIKLGVFNIEDPQHSVNGVEIVAYDNMSKFDKKVSSLFLVSGTFYQFIYLCCSSCGVTLGMTEQEIQAMPNGTETRELYPSNDIETYRDVISWCAQSLSSNALINRDGELIFKCYSDTPCDTLVSKDRRVGGKCSDFDTFYTGISMVNIKDQTTSYYGLSPDNGLTMNLGSNPFLQLMEGETQQNLDTKRRRILNGLTDINYTPFSVGVTRPMIYDLMDVVNLSEGIVGEFDIIGCITKFEWSFINGYRITGVGSNPALASAKSKTDKNISGLLSETKEVKEEVVAITETYEEQQEEISNKQNFIDLDLLEPSQQGVDGDIVLNARTNNALVFWRYTSGAWVKMPFAQYSDQDLIAGTSPLAEGEIYLVYE